MILSRFFHRAIVNAPVEVAWDIFTDHERIGRFTLRPFKITKPGHPDRNGLGAIRVIDMGDMVVEEIVNHWHVNKLYGYHVLSGPPVTHHQGLVWFHRRGPNLTEWIYEMMIGRSAEQVAATPAYADRVQRGFNGVAFSMEAECERRGFEIEVPALPIPISETGLP